MASTGDSSGWSTKETWHAAQVFDNVEDLYKTYTDIASDLRDGRETTASAAARLKAVAKSTAAFSTAAAGPEASFDFEAVNWDEIAEGMTQ